MSGDAGPPLVGVGERVVTSAPDMEQLGRELAPVLTAGDLLVLSGDLGAGKTTMTRGLGEGLGVRGAVTSPTFVIARVHPAVGERPALVHVDAYRLGSLAELDDLDLDAAQADSITVVEWGLGLAEELAASRLEVDITRPKGTGDETDEHRVVRWRAFGGRWAGVRLPGLAEGPG